MPFRMHRPRQVVGLIYIVTYLVFFMMYAFIRSDDQSWTLESKFTIAVMIWFMLSLAVKVFMFMDRSNELLNLIAIVAFMSIGFTYFPQPDHFSSVENLCYYLNFSGGSACDLFDFVYEAASRGPEDSLVGPDRRR